MVQKKPASKKRKSKPPLKPAKKISVNKSKTTLDTIQITLKTVVEKLNQHGNLFDQINDKLSQNDVKMNQMGQNIVKIDQDLGKIRLDNENRILPLMQELGNKYDHLSLKIDDVEDRLNNKIEEVHQDLKLAITGSNEKIQDHDRRISALESRPA